VNYGVANLGKNVLAVVLRGMWDCILFRGIWAH